MWWAICRPFLIPDKVGDPQTWAARVLALSYCFLVLLMVNLYTGKTAARLMSLKVENNIRSRADLPGKAVETWTESVPFFRKYDINADGLAW
jgi:hypothetical protein